MSELASVLGDSVRHPFKVRGKDYSIGLITQDIKVAFAKSVYAKAREGVASLRSDMDKDDYLAMLAKLADEYTLGEFAMEGKRGQAFLLKPLGRIVLLSLLLGVNEHEAMRILVDEDAAAEIQVLLRTVMKESFPGIKDEVLDEGQQSPKVPQG